MDNFTKIEMIVNGRLKERKVELERCKKPELTPYGANTLYVLGVEHEVTMLTRIAGDIDAIKKNHILSKTRLCKRCMVVLRFSFPPLIHFFNSHFQFLTFKQKRAENRVY